MVKKEQDFNVIDACERKSSRVEVMKVFEELRMPGMSLDEINDEIHEIRKIKK